MSEQPDYVLRNRGEWDGWAAEYVPTAERNWAAEEAWKARKRRG